MKWHFFINKVKVASWSVNKTYSSYRCMANWKRWYNLSFRQSTRRLRVQCLSISKASEEAKNRFTQNHLRKPFSYKLITNIMQWWVHQSTYKYTSLLLRNNIFVVFFNLLCFYNGRKSLPTLTLKPLMLQHRFQILLTGQKFPVSFFFIYTINLLQGHFMCITSVSTTSEWNDV